LPSLGRIGLNAPMPELTRRLDRMKAKLTRLSNQKPSWNDPPGFYGLWRIEIDALKKQIRELELKQKHEAPAGSASVKPKKKPKLKRKRSGIKIRVVSGGLPSLGKRR
jgi:hypothetical protein